MSDPQRPHGLQHSRPLSPWDFPGESTGVGAVAFSVLLSNSNCPLLSPLYGYFYDFLKLLVTVRGQYTFWLISLLLKLYMTCYQNVAEGNGTPLQYSCLENPMDGGAWWATVHGVAKSRT